MGNSNMTTKHRWRGQRVGGYLQLRAKAPQRGWTTVANDSGRKQTHSSDVESEQCRKILWNLENMW